MFGACARLCISVHVSAFSLIDAILAMQVTRLPVLPELCVFLTNRFLPYPVILQQVRCALEMCMHACLDHTPVP